MAKADTNEVGSTSLLAAGHYRGQLLPGNRQLSWTGSRTWKSRFSSTSTSRLIESIFTLKKDLLALRKVLAPERDVLNVLIRRDLPIFEQHTLVYFQDVYDHVVRITDSIDTYRDLLSSALDSYLSMQSNHLNITVQTLTSVSIILMTISPSPAGTA